MSYPPVSQSGKKLARFACVLLAFLFIFSSGQTVAQILSSSTGQWGGSGTWIGGIVPGPGDVVVIQGGHTVTVSINTDVIGSLTVNAGGILNIAPLATASLSIDGPLTVNGTLTNSGRIDLLNPYPFNLTGTYTHNPRANVAADETIFEKGIENFSPTSNLVIEKWSDVSIPLGDLTRVTGDFGNVTLSVAPSGSDWDQDGRFSPARIKGDFTVNEGEVMMDDGTGNSQNYTMNDVLITGTGAVTWFGGANRPLNLDCNSFVDNSTNIVSSKLKSICYGAVTWNIAGDLTLGHKFFVIEGTLSEVATATINVGGNFNISGDSVSIMRQVSGVLNLNVTGNTVISGNPSYVRFMEGNTGIMTFNTNNLYIQGGTNNILVGGNAAIPAPTSPAYINILNDFSVTANSSTVLVSSDININRTVVSVGGNFISSASAANLTLANTNGNLLFDLTGNFTQTNGNFSGQSFAGNIKADSIMIGGNFLFNSPTATNFFYGNRGAGTTGGTTFRVLGNFTITTSGVLDGQGVYGVYQANSPLNFYVGGDFLLTQGRYNGIFNGDGNFTSVINGVFTQNNGIYRGVHNLVSQQSGIASFTANALTYNRGQFSVFFANSILFNTAIFNVLNNVNITFFAVQDTFSVIGVELVEPSSNEKRLLMTIGGNLSVAGAAGTFVSSKAKGREVVNITGNVTFAGGVNTFNSSLLFTHPNGHPVNMNIGGNLTVTGGNTFLSSRADSLNCTVNGNLSISGGSLSVKGGAGFAVMTINGGYSQTNGSFFIHNSTTIANTETSPAQMTINADGDNNGDFLHSAGIFTYDNNANALSVAPAVTVKSPNFTIGPAGTMTKTSNTLFGVLNFVRSGATISFSRSGAYNIQEIKQNIILATTLDVVAGNLQIGSYSNAPSSTDFLKVDNSSVLDLRGNKVFSNQQYGFSGLLILTGRVRTQHPFGIFNNTNNAAFDATGNLDYYLLPTSTVEYYGVDNQVISGIGLGIATLAKHQYGNLEINFQGTPNTEWVYPTNFPNASSVWVRNQLILTNGELNLDDDHVGGSGGKNIIIRSTGSSTLPPILRTNGFIRAETYGNNGNVIWRHAAGALSSITIPFGFSSLAADYVPLTLTPVGAKFDSLVVTTFRTAVNNTPFPPTVAHVNNLGGADNSLQTVDRFWKIEATGTFTSVNAGFRCTASEQGAIVNPRAQRWIPASLGWALPVGAQANMAPFGTQANTQPPTLSGWWTLAAILNPLPVELLDFKAECEDVDMKISWITGSEINNDFFTVERGSDGIEFEPIASVKGAGNSSSAINYAINDISPIKGVNYYRLKQTDFDGYFKYSEVISHTSCSDIHELNIFTYVESNRNIQLVMEANGSEKATITVTDLSGRIVYRQAVVVAEGFNQFTIPGHTFSQGMYLVSLKGELNSFSDKIIIK